VNTLVSLLAVCAAAGTVASPASTSTTTAPMLRHKERTKELYMVFIVGSKKGET